MRIVNMRFLNPTYLYNNLGKAITLAVAAAGVISSAIIPRNQAKPLEKLEKEQNIATRVDYHPIQQGYGFNMNNNPNHEKFDKKFLDDFESQLSDQPEDNNINYAAWPLRRFNISLGFLGNIKVNNTTPLTQQKITDMVVSAVHKFNEVYDNILSRATIYMHDCTLIFFNSYNDFTKGQYLAGDVNDKTHTIKCILKIGVEGERGGNGISNNIQPIDNVFRHEVAHLLGNAMSLGEYYYILREGLAELVNFCCELNQSYIDNTKCHIDQTVDESKFKSTINSSSLAKYTFGYVYAFFCRNHEPNALNEYMTEVGKNEEKAFEKLWRKCSWENLKKWLNKMSKVECGVTNEEPNTSTTKESPTSIPKQGPQPNVTPTTANKAESTTQESTTAEELVYTQKDTTTYNYTAETSSNNTKGQQQQEYTSNVSGNIPWNYLLAGTCSGFAFVGSIIGIKIYKNKQHKKVNNNIASDNKEEIKLLNSNNKDIGVGISDYVGWGGGSSVFGAATDSSDDDNDMSRAAFLPSANVLEPMVMGAIPHVDPAG